MEKTDLLFQMLEQPDRYSDQEWEEILADEECRELYTLMAKMKGAAMSEELSDTRRLAAAPRRHTAILSFRKIAALFLGIVMLSGLAYAAVRTSFFTQSWNKGAQAVPTVVVDAVPSLLTIVPNDSVQKPQGTVTFDNHELADILTSICNAYRVEIVFKDEEQKHIRLHFSYDTKDKLEDVIESMNTFQKFRLEMKENKLNVE
ncbi:MAG: DUF4974 domain-containing protein [Bacteroidaceae bacterium]|nr:DUF4974 domain-containing protein [Bacteroidaceae bacterium]